MPHDKMSMCKSIPFTSLTTWLSDFFNTFGPIASVCCLEGPGGRPKSVGAQAGFFLAHAVLSEINLDSLVGFLLG